MINLKNETVIFICNEITNNKHNYQMDVPVPIIDLRYQLGKIYYIYSPSHPEVGFYIGSTIQKIKDRFSRHKSKYKGYLAGKPDSYCSSSEILKYGDAVIVKLEDYFCNNEFELKLREKSLIKLNRTRCVNKYTPAPTAEERKATKQAYDQAYKQAHAQEIRAYYQAHAQEIRAYRQAHAQEIKAKHQAYNQIYVICECGERINKHHKARHLRSQKHITAMANLTQ